MLNPHKIEKWGRGFIYISLFIPLLIIPFTAWEYVFVRNLIFYCLSAVLVLFSLLYLYKNKHNISFFATRLFWIILLFVTVKILSGIFGMEPKNSFFGSEFRMDGNLGYVMLFGWLLAVLLFLDGQERWRKAFKISAIAALVTAVFAVIQAFFPAEWGAFAGKGETPFLNHRLIGSLGNPIFLAGYLLPHVFLCLYLFLDEKNKKCGYFWIAAALFLAVIILLTQTRGAIISLAVTFFILAATATVYFLKNNKKMLRKAALFGLPFLAVSGILIRLLAWDRIMSVFMVAGTAVTRFIFWKIGLLGFADRWLFGWGPENFSYAFSKFYDPMLLKYSFYETWADKPHNQLIELLSTTGILGFAAFAAIIFFALRALWRLATTESFNNIRTSFLPYLCIGGALISYLGHIFFAFDTLEPRLAVFMILGFIIFSEGRHFYQGKKTSIASLKRISIILFLVSVYSLAIIGSGTFRAAYYTNRAHNSIIDNQYSDAVLYFNKLKNIKTPYANNNWEFLSDSVLKADAIGRLPQIVRQEILPIVISGLEKAARGSADNFSYHFRLGQMYNLAGTHLNSQYLDKSIAELMKARQISPKRQVTDLTLAQVYYAKRDVASGIKTLEDLVGANEDVSPEPYWYLGIFYDAAGQYDKSYAYMSAAVERGRGFISQDERILYVTVLGRQEDYKRMAPVYEEILKYDGQNPRWWANVAAVYLELKEYDKARNATRQAIFLAPAFGDEGGDFLKKIDKAEAGK